MTPLFPAQRAAEEFDSVLDGRATTAVAERYAGLAATVQVLRDQPEVMPRAEFAADLRERLMAVAEAEMVPTTPVVRRIPPATRRRRRVGTVAAALVIVGGSTGMAAAASGSLPGEALYPIKRGIEQVTIAAHVGDASKGSALLGQADERLDELQELLASGSADPALVDQTVSDFTGSANSGADKLFKAYQADGDAADVTAVRDFTAAAMQQVSSMSHDADPSTLGALRDTADTLADLDQQAAALCATCGGDVLSPPDALAAGSGAAAVFSLVARPVNQARADIRSARAAQAALDEKQLDGLKNAAQGAADQLGRSSSTSPDGSSAALGKPLTSTLDSAGKLVPSLTTSSGTAVNNLVGGITGSLSAATDAVTSGGGGGGDGGVADKVKGAVKGAGDAADKTVDGVTKGLDKTVDGLTKGLQQKDK